VINMDEATANMKVNEQRLWLAENDAGSKNLILESIISGLENATTDEERDDMWAAYRSTAHTVEVDGVKVKTAPVKKGRKQNPILAGSLSTIEPMLQEAFSELVNNHPIISAITMPTARHGGTWNSEELVAELVRQNYDGLKRTFYAERWDGTLNKKGLPVITPHPVVEQTENSEDTEDV